MTKRTARLSMARDLRHRRQVNLPEVFVDLERQGIDLNRPFTVTVDAVLGIVEAEQPVRSPEPS